MDEKRKPEEGISEAIKIWNDDARAVLQSLITTPRNDILPDSIPTPENLARFAARVANALAAEREAHAMGLAARAKSGND